MKGISDMIVGVMGGLIIVAVMFLFAQKVTGSYFDDKVAATKIAAMGLRNEIIHVSLTERGIVQYNMPESDKYDVEITGYSIKIQYAGKTLPTLKPLVEIPLYTHGVVPKTMSGSEFCIAGRRDIDHDCIQVISVCEKGEADYATCCSVDTSNC